MPSAMFWTTPPSRCHIWFRDRPPAIEKNGRSYRPPPDLANVTFPASLINWPACRLPTGIWATVVRSMNCPTVVFSVSRSGAEPVTSMVSVISPISNWMPTVLVKPVSITMPDWWYVLNPMDSQNSS